MTEKKENNHSAGEKAVNPEIQELAESKKKNKTDEIMMASDIVDQINYNQQSNMSLSVYSVITQSYSTIKINISDNDDRED
ncbi:MAG: hypothetical protein GX175_05970 [Halanaerobiaceae bacterium]|jgi:hypothetical protein|nr:hypothetical protein [Halanaerobiaceae bacterium]